MMELNQYEETVVTEVDAEQTEVVRFSFADGHPVAIESCEDELLGSTWEWDDLASDDDEYEDQVDAILARCG